MTYEEYKNKKEPKKHNFIKKILAKLFTVIIFTMTVIIISNYNETFRNFLINDVLNNTMDFSKINNLLDKTTSIFSIDKTIPVYKEEKESEEYLDGVKYKVSSSEKVYLKDSGIVTFIGEKDGYNNTIIIQQSNGYYAWYGNIKESVKLYDYVESGNEIGSADNEYYYVLYKDEKPIKNENRNS